MGISRLFKRLNKDRGPKLLEAVGLESSFTVVSTNTTGSQPPELQNEGNETLASKINYGGTTRACNEAYDSHSTQSVRSVVAETCEEGLPEENHKATTTHSTELNIENSENEVSNEICFVENAEEVPGMSITVVEKLKQFICDQTIPQEIRTFIKRYLENHGNPFFRESSSNVTEEKPGVTEVAVAIPIERASVQKVRPASIARRLPLHKTHSLILQNRTSFIRPTSLTGLQFELDWPFYLRNQRGTEDSEVPSPSVMPPANYPVKSSKNHRMSIKAQPVPPDSTKSIPKFSRNDSMSSMSSSATHSSLYSHSNAPSLTHTATTVSSKYSTITEEDSELIAYKEHYPVHPEEMRTNECCSTSQSSYNTNKDPCCPTQYTHRLISRTVSNQVRFELNNPNAYCGSAAMSGPYPCIPNRKSVRADGTFKRLSGVIPTAYYIDE